MANGNRELIDILKEKYPAISSEIIDVYRVELAIELRYIVDSFTRLRIATEEPEFSFSMEELRKFAKENNYSFPESHGDKIDKMYLCEAEKLVQDFFNKRTLKFKAEGYLRTKISYDFS